MLGFFRKDRKSYEIMLRNQDGRWTLQGVEDSQAEALTTARRALTSGTYIQAKVTQHSHMPSGSVFETVIFDEVAKARAEKPVGLCDPPPDVTVCQSVEDLYGSQSRRAISAVLHDYLGKCQITATELMHGWPHLRKFQDAGGLMAGAIHRLSVAQTRLTGEDTRSAQERLAGLVEQALGRVRGFQAVAKTLPAFDRSDLATWMNLASPIIGINERAFVVRAVVSQSMLDVRSLQGRLELALALRTERVEALEDVVDDLVSDALTHSEVIKDLFGPQVNLGAFLIRLADLLAEAPGAIDACPTPSLKCIMLKIQDGSLPQCRAALMDRLLHEISSTKPLDRIDPSKDPQIMARLAQRLIRPDGTMLGTTRMTGALDARRERHRQQMLQYR